MPSQKIPHLYPQRVRLGYIALTDCAPLLVADELGFFATHGVSVDLSQEVGWATIREKILYRQLDAAHSVAGLVLSLRLGLDGLKCPAIAPFVFNLNGNAITLSTALWRHGVRDGSSLHKLIRSTPQRLFSFGVVARCSSHHFLMRRWLQRGGINPDRDVRLVVLPPTQMAGALRDGLIDGFCAGEPWNSLAVAGGHGWCPALSADLQPGHPEKVLLTTSYFVDEHGTVLEALIRGLSEACAWCDVPQNRPKLVQILKQRGLREVSETVLARSLVGPFDDGNGHFHECPDFHIFHRRGANYPSLEKGLWILEEFVTHGLISPDQKPEAHRQLLQCWRADLYDQAFAQTASIWQEEISSSNPVIA